MEDLPDYLSRLKKIGITGGICSGKSNILRIVKDHGYPIIEGDQLGHMTYEPNTETYDQLIQEFGEQIVGENKYINRRALGGIVFSNPDKMKRLNEIVWPKIRALAIQKMIEYYNNGHKIIFMEAAIMIESGMYKIFDEVWLSVVPREVAIERLMERNKLSRDEAEKRLNSQSTNEERMPYATFIIDTNQPIEQTGQIINQKLQSMISKM